MAVASPSRAVARAARALLDVLLDRGEGPLDLLGLLHRADHPNARAAEGNFRCVAVLPVVVSRLLVILTLLAAAVPAAASAQDPSCEPPVAVTGAADAITRDRRQPQRHGRSQRLADHLPLRVRHDRRPTG